MGASGGQTEEANNGSKNNISVSIQRTRVRYTTIPKKRDVFSVYVCTRDGPAFCDVYLLLADGMGAMTRTCPSLSLGAGLSQREKKNVGAAGWKLGLLGLELGFGQSAPPRAEQASKPAARRETPRGAARCG